MGRTSASRHAPVAGAGQAFERLAVELATAARRWQDQHADPAVVAWTAQLAAYAGAWSGAMAAVDDAACDCPPAAPYGGR